MPLLAGDYTYTDYQDVQSNLEDGQEIKVVKFCMSEDPSEWYVRLYLDMSGEDTLLTFGPLSQSNATLLKKLLRKHYCHLCYEVEGPFEFERGNPVSTEEEEEEEV